MHQVVIKQVTWHTQHQICCHYFIPHKAFSFVYKLMELSCINFRWWYRQTNMSQCWPPSAVVDCSWRSLNQKGKNWTMNEQQSQTDLHIFEYIYVHHGVYLVTTSWISLPHPFPLIHILRPLLTVVAVYHKHRRRDLPTDVLRDMRGF